jgi:hypothetical protein
MKFSPDIGAEAAEIKPLLYLLRTSLTTRAV